MKLKLAKMVSFKRTASRSKKKANLKKTSNEEGDGLYHLSHYTLALTVDTVSYTGRNKP